MSEIISFFHTFHDIVAALESLLAIGGSQVDYQREILDRLDRIILFLEKKS